MDSQDWRKQTLQNLIATNEKLHAEIERLRKELASWRKGDCRRKIDKAMEGE
jgi:regulator of replication initiation timing